MDRTLRIVGLFRFPVSQMADGFKRWMILGGQDADIALRRSVFMFFNDGGRMVMVTEGR
jgi:hypothetical protein